MSAAGKFRERIKVYTPAVAVADGIGGFLVAGAATEPLSAYVEDDYVVDDYVLPSALPMLLSNSNAEKLLELWADVKVLQAKEYLINNKITYKQPFKITLRYNSAISNLDRIVWNNQQLGITSLISDARKTELTLICYANS